MTPNILGLGHDLIEIDRIQKALDRFGSAFLHRIFTFEELSYCLSIKLPTPSLAARFAAKEAVAKALGTGIGAIVGWHDIEIHKDSFGKPFCRFSAKALAHFGSIEVLITLTHTHIHASAVALALKS